MGFVLSIAFSFPLVIFPCRASIYSLLYRRGHADATGYIPEVRFKMITISIVLFSLSIALLIPSIELVIGLVGSTIGVAICIMFPASCFVKVFKKDSTEKRLAQLILISGFCLMILGTYANLLAIDEKHSGHTSVVVEEKKVEKVIIFENLSENLKPTELHQGEKPIELSFPKIPMKEKIANVKLNEKGNEEKIKNVNLSQQVNLDAPQIEARSTNKPETKSESTNAKEQPLVDVNQNNPDINKDAIKKEEDMVKEEEQKQLKAANNAETELKKTKELLEKKVDELKEQLKQQNEETKNLVEEKLVDIVEKVEQIQREVKKDKNEEEKFKDTNETPQINQQENIIKEQVNIVEKEKIKTDLGKDSKIKKYDSGINEVIPPNPKGSLINMLTENLKEKRKPSEVNNTAFEPLSYKTGEIINKIHKAKINESKSPLPLPLLINASIPKSQDVVNKKDDAEKPTKQIKSTKDEEEVPKQNDIESIRRDILQANTEKEHSTVVAAGLENFKREKRNIARNSCVNWDTQLDDCLDKKSFDSMLPQNIANLKVESIGRDLKSIKEKP